MKSKGLATTLFWASIISAVLAVLDALSVSVWLAATTWLLVATVTAVWAIFTDECKPEK